MAGFNARGAEQAGNLLEMELDGVGAEDFGLRKVDAGVADRVHARFELGNIVFEVEVRGRHIETPLVNAFGDVMEAAANVGGELTERRLEPVSEAVFIFAASLDRQLKRNESVIERAAKLREHAETFAPSWATRGLKACCFEVLIVSAEHGERVFTSGSQVGGWGAVEAGENGLKECAEDKELLSQAIAKVEARTVGQDEGGDGESDDDAEDDFKNAVEREAPAGAGTLDQHDDCDGDAGEARAAAQAEQAADDDGGENGEDVVPGEHAEEGEGEAENGADEGAEDAIARGVDGGSDVGLQDDDGADGAPVAVVQVEEAGENPAERRGKSSFRSVDKKAPALPCEEAGLVRRMNVQAKRELLLRPGFVRLQAHRGIQGEGMMKRPLLSAWAARHTTGGDRKHGHAEPCGTRVAA